MRMRRKKHLPERLDSCEDIIIYDIAPFEGDIKSIFSDDKPMRMEIGCGKGGFILETAKANPDINFLAVEKNKNVLVLAAEKIKKQGLTNVKFLSGDVNMLHGFQTESKCEVIYINFCDPWHKHSYRRKRLTHRIHLALWQKLLNEHGEIHFKTDNKMLFEFSLNSFSDYGMRLRNITLDLHNSDFEGNIMTEYEKLFSEKGQPIYRCEAIYQ